MVIKASSTLDVLVYSDSDVILITTRSKSKSIKVLCNSCNNNLQHLNDLMKLISTLETKFSDSINQMQKHFEAQITELKSSISQQQQSHSLTQFEDLVQEVTERQKRACNVVIFGVAEASNMPSEQQTESDNAETNHILNALNPSMKSKFKE